MAMAFGLSRGCGVQIATGLRSQSVWFNGAAAVTFVAVTTLDESNRHNGSQDVISCEGPPTTVTSNGRSHAVAAGLKLQEAGKSPAKIQTRMTSIGRFALMTETVVHPSIITSMLTLTGTEPLSVPELVELWKARGMPERFPRFHQSISPHTPGYFQYSQSDPARTKSTQHGIGMETDDVELDISKHFVETLKPVIPRKDILQRICALQTTPWDLTDSLWKFYVTPWASLGSSGTIDVEAAQSNLEPDASKSALKESTILLQAHHILADGASLNAALMDFVDEASLFRAQIANALQKRNSHIKSSWLRWYRKVLRWIWLVTASARALVHHAYLLALSSFEPDPWHILRLAASEAELSQRSVSYSLVAPLEQVKWVARTVGGSSITVNDVMTSCIAAAMAQQLQYHRQNHQLQHTLLGYGLDDDDKIAQRKYSELPYDSYLHVALPVHLNGGIILPGHSLGNKIGGITVRLPCEAIPVGTLDASRERLLAVHYPLKMAKKSPAALLSHVLAKTLSSTANWITPQTSSTAGGIPWMAWMYKRSHAGALVAISNNRGPSHPVHVAGRRIEAMYGFVPLPTGIPVGVVVLSYAGHLNVTVTAQPWAVPDADQFCIWILEEYSRLLVAAQQKKSQIATDPE